MLDDGKEPQVTKKVALYIRVSTEDQEEKFGIPMQQDALEALIKSKGKYDNGQPKYELADDRYIYIDGDVSGTTPLVERPSFSKLLEDLEFSGNKKPFDVIAVYKIDRLARRLTVLLDAFELLKQHKIQLVSANESIDTSTPFGRAILGIVGVIAELELETIKERTDDGRRLAFERGVVSGPHSGYGYIKNKDLKRIILPEEAEIVKRIFYEYVYQNKTPQSIANGLKADSVVTSSVSAMIHGKVKSESKNKKVNSDFLWQHSEIKKILGNEVYIGKYYYYKTKNKKTLPKDQWKLSSYRHEAIIDDQTFELAQKRMADRSEKKETSQKSSDSHQYILSGLLKCDHCKSGSGHKLKWVGNRKEIGKGSGNYSYYYMCPRKNRTKHTKRCDTLPVPAEEIDEYVTNFIKSLLSDPKATYEYQMNLKSTRIHIKHIKAKLERLRNLHNGIPARIDNLKTMFEHGYISIEELNEKIKKAHQDKDKYLKEINALEIEQTRQEMPIYYIKSFEEFAKKYKKGLKSVFEDNAAVNKLLKELISEIVLYSRPLKPDEKVSGPKVKRQRYILDEIKIVLNLPTDMLRSLITNPEVKSEFVVRSDNL